MLSFSSPVSMRIWVPEAATASLLRSPFAPKAAPVTGSSA